MSIMACLALDWLVAAYTNVEVRAEEDGVYLPDGTRWQPTVNWNQCGPYINRFNVYLDMVCNRHQPHMAKTSYAEWGTCGETQQVAICNLVVTLGEAVYRKDGRTQPECPYVPVKAIDLAIREEQFIKKYPKLKIDDIDALNRINETGVAAYLLDGEKIAADVSKFFGGRPVCNSHRELVDLVVHYYPELITVEAHAMGLPVVN